jgi:hypothetical protein
MRNENPSPAEDSRAALEQLLIDEFLGARGHTLGSVSELPAHEAERLLRAASEHASLRLAEIESRAHYVNVIHRPS